MIIEKPFSNYLNSVAADRVKAFVAIALDVKQKDIQILAMNSTLESPKGYHLKFNRCVAVQINGGAEFGGQKERYFSCDYSQPASLNVLSEDELRDFIDDMNAQIYGTEVYDDTPVPFDYWIARSYMQALNWEVTNAFTTYEYLMSQDGRIDDIDYKKGDVLRYNPSRFIEKINLDHVQHIRVFD